MLWQWVPGHGRWNLVSSSRWSRSSRTILRWRTLFVSQRTQGGPRGNWGPRKAMKIHEKWLGEKGKIWKGQEKIVGFWIQKIAPFLWSLDIFSGFRTTITLTKAIRRLKPSKPWKWGCTSYLLMNQQKMQDGKAHRDLGKAKKSVNRQGFGMFLSLDGFWRIKNDEHFPELSHATRMREGIGICALIPGMWGSSEHLRVWKCWNWAHMSIHVHTFRRRQCSRFTFKVAVQVWCTWFTLPKMVKFLDHQSLTGQLDPLVPTGGSVVPFHDLHGRRRHFWSSREMLAMYRTECQASGAALDGFIGDLGFGDMDLMTHDNLSL